MAMGAADVVPGVSGGTIAFISGIYEELIDSLRTLDWTAVRVLLRDGLGPAWRHINGNFLLTVFCGIIVSILTLANVVNYSLENFPILVWAFFFGLVCASSVFIGRQLGAWSWREIVALLLGFALAWWVGEIKPAQLPSDWWVIMLAGSVAICAMILPGVSGSFILLILGLYTTIIDGLLAIDIGLIGSFVAGCVVGLLCFSHILSWLLHHYHKPTLALLTGFLLGSLNVIWPWKQILQTTIDRHGELIPVVQENLLPWQFFDATGRDPQVMLALLLALFGAILVFGLELFAKKGQAEKSPTVES
jgi:putative membrane protein